MFVVESVKRISRLKSVLREKSAEMQKFSANVMWKAGKSDMSITRDFYILRLHKTGSIYQKKGSGMTITVYTQWSAAKRRLTLSTTKMVDQLSLISVEILLNIYVYVKTKIVVIITLYILSLLSRSSICDVISPLTVFISEYQLSFYWIAVK